MELSAESRVVLDLARYEFRLCGRGSRVSRKTLVGVTYVYGDVTQEYVSVGWFFAADDFAG